MLTRARAEELLREAVAERGEGYIYSKPEHMDTQEACLYVHTDTDGKRTPGCGVGVVLHKHGVSLGHLRMREGMAAEAAVPELVRAVEPEAVGLLGRFQSAQDHGWPWGRALEKALSEESPTLTQYDPARHGEE